ncbi:rhodanese-like domain-containing protein [Halorhabdus sp. BNX81]|uniref:rhodanese-like domain-containing protein n=1 Tax=Halorhabdus sp. BNX81 TaxID=2980181 RepID=UPI0023DD513D|nr:rhodanese-like domain-containing protein [Halorhabdus sp. BNX81]WEL21554.1 Ferredoxin-nitrite reductase [Halorhabdus sp. BNX81]
MSAIEFIPPAALGDRDAAIVDVREASAYTDLGHVPGAANIPVDRFRDPTGIARGMLPDPTDLATWLGEAGISPTDPVIAYDDDCGVYAARFLATLGAFGHDGDLYLLDGDYSVYEREADVTVEQPDIEPVEYEPGDLDETLLADREDVEAAVDGEAIVVDTRTEPEFEQAHIPGAVQLDWKAFVDDETGRRRSVEAVESTLAEHGLEPDRPVVLYCNTARRLSYVFAVLEDLGYGDVRFYEGSLEDWLRTETDDWDPAEIKRRVREHANEGPETVKEALGEDAAAKLKLVGLYEQKQSGYFMFRTKIPGGVLTADAARALGTVAEEYATLPEERDPERSPFGDGYLDVTTRQDVQFHWIRMADVPEIWELLDPAGVSTFQTGGNSVRNVVSCPAAGVADDEVLDARPVAEAITEAFLADRRYANLPRKLKVSVNGCRGACAQPEINDLGFTPARKGDRVGFNLAAGGGLSDSPRVASDLDVFVERDQVVDVVRATADLFIEHGSYLDTAVNRLRFLVEEWGAEQFREELQRFAPFEFESAGEDLVTHHHPDHVGVHDQADGDKYVGLSIPVGRIDGTDFRGMADLAGSYGNSEIRLTTQQNLLLPDVADGDLDDLRAEPLLDEYSPDPGPFTRGVVTCTGREFCNYALVETKARAKRWAAELDERVDIDQDRVGLRFSGCTASCAQPQIDDIGLRGETRQTDDGVESAVDIAVGGKLDVDPQFATWIAPRVPIESAPDAIERLVAVFEREGRDGEQLHEFCRRVDDDRLAEVLHPAAIDPVEAAANGGRTDAD